MSAVVICGPTPACTRRRYASLAARVKPIVGCLRLDMVGQQITVEYFDQNEDFKTLLPRSGRIVQELSLTDWGSGWELVELDKPFDYQYRYTDPYVFKELHVTQLLVKSRWKGFAVGGAEPTSVFVLIVLDPAALTKDTLSSKDFINVCWGMVH